MLIVIAMGKNQYRRAIDELHQSEKSLEIALFIKDLYYDLLKKDRINQIEFDYAKKQLLTNRISVSLDDTKDELSLVFNAFKKRVVNNEDYHAAIMKIFTFKNNRTLEANWLSAGLISIRDYLSSRETFTVKLLKRLATVPDNMPEIVMFLNTKYDYHIVSASISFLKSIVSLRKDSCCLTIAQYCGIFGPYRASIVDDHNKKYPFFLIKESLEKNHGTV